MRPANDNRQIKPRDKLIELLLKGSVALEEQISKGLQVLLELHNVPREVRREVREYTDEVTKGFREIEGGIIVLAREVPMPLLGEAFGKMLESYATEFERLATTPDQERMAETFRHFTVEIAGTLRQNAEKDRDVDLER